MAVKGQKHPGGKIFPAAQPHPPVGLELAANGNWIISATDWSASQGIWDVFSTIDGDGNHITGYRPNAATWPRVSSGT
jgi:hypothetical protein